MRCPIPRCLAAAALALALAGCVTDGAPRTSARDGDETDRAKRMCEQTSVGGEAKTVCY